MHKLFATYWLVQKKKTKGKKTKIGVGEVSNREIFYAFYAELNQTLSLKLVTTPFSPSSKLKITHKLCISFVKKFMQSLCRSLCKSYAVEIYNECFAMISASLSLA